MKASTAFCICSE